MANTTNFGWETPDDTDLVKDGALAMRTLGNAIDTSLVDLKGGTTGQVLSKNTNTDMDFTWVTPNDADAIQNSIVDAKGDLISATADNTPARLASSGVNGQVLTIDTSTATGLKWAAASSGAVKQIVYSTFDTTYTTTSTSFNDIGLSATITPSSTASNILIYAMIPYGMDGSGATGFITLTDGSNNNLCNPASAGSRTPAFIAIDVDDTGPSYGLMSGVINFRHSPNTTSSFTYKIRARVTGSGPLSVNRMAAADTDNSGYVRSVATLILMEI